MRTDRRIASKKDLTKRLEDATRVKIDLQLFAGELIGSVLHHTGMRNKDLAEKLGVTNVHLSMVKNGKTRLTIDVAARLLEVLERSLEPCEA